MKYYADSDYGIRYEIDRAIFEALDSTVEWDTVAYGMDKTVISKSKHQRDPEFLSPYGDNNHPVA